MDLSVLALSLAGWWSLSGRLRHHPELVGGIAATGLAISTVSTGTIVPALSNQTIGYLVLVPGLVAAAEWLRMVVLDVASDTPPFGRVSVSVGATFIAPSDLDETDDQWIARADAGRYEVKNAGRDRVCLRGR